MGPLHRLQPTAVPPAPCAAGRGISTRALDKVPFPTRGTPCGPSGDLSPKWRPWGQPHVCCHSPVSPLLGAPLAEGQSPRDLGPPSLTSCICKMKDRIITSRVPPSRSHHSQPGTRWAPDRRLACGSPCGPPPAPKLCVLPVGVLMLEESLEGLSSGQAVSGWDGRGQEQGARAGSSMWHWPRCCFKDETSDI